MDIIVENLVKKYGSQKAVDNISFTVKTGEVLGFLGPNGAGKTTTMKAITTFLIPNSGNIYVGEYSVNRNPEEVKKNIGYLPENNPLYEDMPVIDYLRFVGDLHGISKENIDDSLLSVIEICGLDAEKHKKINELSKGYKQRVGLAQALIHKPDVLVLDEPTSGLDPNQIIEIRDLIRRIGREKTVILSSHILAEVEATCDRILIINKGKIVADGTTADLRKQAQGKDVLRLRIEGADINTIYNALKEIDGVDMVDIYDADNMRLLLDGNPKKKLAAFVFNFCVKNNWVLTELIPVETKLEDIFKELTTE
ncbi:MAG: ATP-binding cassette domain-containing protein [Bacteroidetes bacterium]|nr:ATP-binding cassette domain-containing protein [Bacteroidota bacterium]MBL6944415.1 ATP-binding cassette domain-containing protein [Bacteroidales bacterium]